MARPLRFILPLFAALLLAPSAGAKAPLGDAFYTPPASLPGSAHGDVVWFRNAGPTNYTTLAGASRNYLVLYRSSGIAGTAVADSGSLAIPRGTPPKGGWPVITWAHGTTGLADKCAYSIGGPVAKDRDWAYLGTWLRQGYAIVATDYVGLGTPGNHPYLNGIVEAHSVVDAVKA